MNVGLYTCLNDCLVTISPVQIARHNIVGYTYFLFGPGPRYCAPALRVNYFMPGHITAREVGASCAVEDFAHVSKLLVIKHMPVRAEHRYVPVAASELR